MHLLAVVLIPFDSRQASIRPLIARDASIWARLDTLLFRYQQPDEQAWGVDVRRGFVFDYWGIGGRSNGWGREARAVMARQRIAPHHRAIPRFIAHNAAWSEDLRRVRLTSSALPAAVLTPRGEWNACPSVLPVFGKPTGRQRKAEKVWQKAISDIASAYPQCLAIAVDYHC